MLGSALGHGHGDQEESQHPQKGPQKRLWKLSVLRAALREQHYAPISGE